MSDYYAEQPTEWSGGDSTDADVAPEAPASKASRRSGRSSGRRGSRSTVTRGQAEVVLDRYEVLSAASDPEREALATVLGSASHEVRALTVALASGVSVKHKRAMRDLLAIASSDDADRDMTALTLAVGQSGAKRLRAAWGLASLLSGRSQNLPGNPVEAARMLSGAAVDVAGVLSVVKSLLG